MKVYTKTGDTGTTSLVGGKRVDKACARLESYGIIDELNAQRYYLGKTAYPGASLTGDKLSGNRFRFEAKNVKEFICRLHPEMADLSRKITAEINGKTFECIPEADDSRPDYRAKITLKAE